ncbi:MAG: ATP-binding protein [Gammaproteobacteria bacterium]|nr:ATP-binding protein [Gammaproteobacteria bacterium]
MPLHSDNLRKVQSNPKKIYLIDSGLINACTTKISPNWGHLFENLVYLDLRRQEKNNYYYLTADRYEVDFLTINLEGERELIQVVWDVNDKETLLREQRALDQAQHELGIPGRIITPEKYLVEAFNTMQKESSFLPKASS